MAMEANIKDDELLGCPFCGARPELEREGEHEDIACLNTSCLVQPRALGIAEYPARQTWNTPRMTGVIEMSEAKRKLLEAAAVFMFGGLWMASFVHLGDRIARDVVPPLMLSFTAAILWGAVMGWILARNYMELKRLFSERG